MPLVKVYIDTSVISRHYDARLKEADATCLEEIAKSKRDEVVFVMSDTVDRELGATNQNARRALLMFVARLSERVEFVPLRFDVPLLVPPVIEGMSPSFVVIPNMEDSLYTSLCTIFDSVDAEHIFHAIKAGCDYFLTLDETSILTHVMTDRAAVEQRCGKTQIVSPCQLAERLRAKG